MDISLKKCPQCGGKGVLRYRKPYHWVQCKNCGYMTAKYTDYCVESEYAVKKIVCNYWNNADTRGTEE